MEFTNEVKRKHLKAFTKVMKDSKGKGPRNIAINYLADEIHVVMEGHISEYEKYLIKNFGQEAIELLRDFHERDIKNVEDNFNQHIKEDYNLEIFELVTDFVSDVFVWKIRVR
jgi:uncharacterized protein YbcI